MSRTESADADDDLILLCKNFRSELREWIGQVERSQIETYEEDGALAGQALHALRLQWGASLAGLACFVPRTLRGAHEKLSAAQDFLEFSCQTDGSAIEFLALATRELDQVNVTHRIFDQTQTSNRRHAQTPSWWFERLIRRA